MHGSILIENISLSRNCDIKTTNTKSVTDASIWVMFIFKDSDTLEIENSLLNSPTSIIIHHYGFHFRSTELSSLTQPIHRIPGQSVNKPRKRLFCDKKNPFKKPYAIPINCMKSLVKACASSILTVF